MGASWGHLGGAFWLKSRLKICQEPPRPLLEYFFSAPGPSPGPFGGPSGSFRDLSKIKRPQEGPRKAQNGPPGSPRKAPQELQIPPREPRKRPQYSKATRVRRAPNNHSGKNNHKQIGNDFIYSARLSGMHFVSPLGPSGSQALRASAGCAKRKQFPGQPARAKTWKCFGL